MGWDGMGWAGMGWAGMDDGSGKGGKLGYWRERDGGDGGVAEGSLTKKENCRAWLGYGGGGMERVVEMVGRDELGVLERWKRAQRINGLRRSLFPK